MIDDFHYTRFLFSTQRQDNSISIPVKVETDSELAVLLPKQPSNSSSISQSTDHVQSSSLPNTAIKLESYSNDVGSIVSSAENGSGTTKEAIVQIPVASENSLQEQAGLQRDDDELERLKHLNLKAAAR